MSVNDLINDHSQQGILLKLQYSDEANQLKFRNELTSDRIIWELPLIQEQKAQIKIKADVDITQLDFKDQKQNLICEKNKIQIINQPFDEINTCYLFKKNNDILTDQIEALSPMSPQNKSCFSNGDQCNQKSFYSKSQYNYIKKEKLKRQTQFQRQNNKRSFHENLIFLTKIKKYALKFFDHYQISSRTIYLNSLIRQRINDNSDFVTQRSNKLIITDIQKKQINSFLYKFPLINIQLINPQSNFGFSTQLFFIVYNWIFFYLFSLGVIFDQQIMRFLNIYIIGITVWVIEILLKLNTVIYNYTQKIETREQIFFIYLKQRSIYDIIPALLLYILYIFQEKINLILNIILSLLICLKLKNMSFDINQIQTQFCKRIKKYYLIQMFNLIFKMFMIAHTIGCLWYLIGLYEKKVLNISTWFDQMFEQTEVWWQLYIYSFYWSLQLMIMGSNTATSLLQINFTIFVTFITAITFGYILNVIGMILEELDRNEINKRQDINVINEYMRQKNISMQFHINSFKYFCNQPSPQIKSQNIQKII